MSSVLMSPLQEKRVEVLAEMQPRVVRTHEEFIGHVRAHRKGIEETAFRAEVYNGEEAIKLG